MKTKLLVAVAVLALALVALAGDEKPWFDMETCSFCKHLIEDPGLLHHCDWEHHKISDGVLTVTTVEDEYLDAFNTAMANMEEAGKKMQSGEMLPMCGMCTAMGNLMMTGAQWESVTTKHGSVSVLTSDDPAVVEKIHAFADRTNDEMAKMMAAEDEHGHEGHDH
ncbi:hypothetical protein GF377_11185 [candidate division GN15 bacterium]|nr:hypothetical protein [candidate division GN15 bacterium]